MGAVDSNWLIHPIFDEEVTHVVETPNYVYFTSMNMEENPTTSVYKSLFRYDKKGEEMIPLSTSNILNSNNVRDVIYNPQKGYLAVLYKDFEIDLLYNDGKVENIPYYSQSNTSYSKDVNSLAIDPVHDRIYLATDFGYVAVNDKKNEIAESRIYGEPLLSFCRLGDDYFAIHGNKLLRASTSAPRLSLTDYEEVATFENPRELVPVGDNRCLIILGDRSEATVKQLIKNGEEIELKDMNSGVIRNIDYNASGVILTFPTHVYQFTPTGDYGSFKRPENFSEYAAGSHNMSELWNAEHRKGLSSLKRNGETWSISRNWMLPSAPATFATTSFVNHPSYGFLMLNYGMMSPTRTLYPFSAYQLSGYKNGRWTQYGQHYTYPFRATTLLSSPNGMVIDPDNNDYAYITSYHSGILRVNLKTPSDIIHLSRASDSDNGRDGFVVLDYVPKNNPGYSNIAAPTMDSQGNIWMNFADWDETDPKPHFYVWTAADRRATTNAANVKQPKHISFDVSMPIYNTSFSKALTKTGKGLIVYAASTYDDELVLLDSNGTPADTSDDKVYKFTSFTDGDGNSLELRYTQAIWEDPSTGYVWLCHANGVCYFVPSQVVNGNYQLNRVKVPRNDGTNLADYLLEGVSVNGMTSDAQGRKWFATAGGGVICTSSDGREILEEFNKSNSPLPSDVVFGVGYNSASNSMMFSTEEGYAEYFLSSAGGSSDKTDIKAYPNPVRPEYSGYVTITDIPQGSFVKITDSAGNLVKELGVMSGFEILWDISDSSFRRVRSGVYHIMVSPSDENGTYSGVGKILVIS